MNDKVSNDADNDKGKNKPGNQDPNHNTKKVSLGPNTKR